MVQVIREAAADIAPFMPGTADSIEKQTRDDKVKKGKPLFPRIDTSKPDK